MIDKANFYKLPKEEQNIEKLWVNTSPDVIQFANNLVEEIKYSDTPFVLGIDGGYGTGKTYFSTRFTEYLKTKDINAIYCSVWENDYLENPFIAISKEIIKSINSTTIKSKTKDILEKLNESIVNVFSCLNISVPIKSVGVSANVKDVYKAIINPWIEQKDEIQQFKSNMANFIKDVEGEKLVLIIDELDRCRPDFAVKTLEILKHLFDIEGLYVILMINKDRLSQHINAFYNIQVIGEEKEEGYLAKFINRYEHIPNLNYEVIVNDFFNQKDNKKIIDDTIKVEVLSNDDYKFNSLMFLKLAIINLCKGNNITYRQSINLMKNCVDFCNFYREPVSGCLEPIRCKILPGILFGSNPRDYFFQLKNRLIKALTKYCTSGFIIANSNDIKRVYDSFLREDYFGNKHLTIAPNEYGEIKKLYDELQTYGSDDNDDERFDRYEEIAKEFNKLYEKSKE